MRRIPKGSREAASSKLCENFEEITRSNTIEVWERLLLLPRRCLYTPSRGGQRWSLASLVNKQIADEESLLPSAQKGSAKAKNAPHDPAKYLCKAISLKLGEGDFRGAIRLACSDDSMAEVNEDTLSSLQAKHSSPHPASNPPTPPLSQHTAALIYVTPEMVVYAIHSFPTGSSGGPDGLFPQHLILNSPSGVTAPFLSSLSAFILHVLNSSTPIPLRPLFFGARLVALTKKDGGVRPIAVGSTLI